MKKLLTAFFVLLSFSLTAQTLFYYGNDSVSVKDFLRAYQKNNTGVRTEKAFRDYLDLYIASRLKIKEARERRYDTLPQMIVDLDNLRQQIIPAYLNDKEGTARLVNEAFVRSQKDIHIAHIFIAQSFGESADEARTKAYAALDEIKAGKDFASVAKKYSNDPSVVTNGGDIGWITVFSLPYELENLAYTTPVGKTGIYQSRVGFHLFKNLGERRDPGRMKASQILLAFPPGSTDQYKAEVKKRADSLYNRLLKGDDFGKLASQFSNDVISAAASGQMQEFGIGQYDPIFEKEVYALTKDGAISKPFLTSHGYHIVKRIAKIPVPTTRTENILQTLQVRAEQNDRINTTKNELAGRILKSVYRKENFNEGELWAFSDSVLNFKTTGMPLHLTYNTALFQIGDKSYSVSEWMNYAQAFRYKSDGSGIKPYTQLWIEFVNTSALEYYQNHLEDFNEEFRQQLTEFREGNLFFEIMQRQVWGPAQTDTVAVEAYFNKNKAKYNWKKSADAVIFYASDIASARTFLDQLKRSPKSWSRLVNNMSEKITADSSRFELEQIPNPAKQPLSPGTITNLLVNKADNTVSFAYIIRNYDKAASRSFQEARGLVINDYQRELEEKWLAELKKKYPVRMNEKVLGELIAAKKF